MLVHSYRTAISELNASWYKILTFRTYDRRRSSKVGQKMIFEYFFHLGLEEHWVIRVKLSILQLHPNVLLELVKFRKYHYHRNLQDPSGQSQCIKVWLDVPFLSGQISSKCFNSSDGRALSIGTQYLKRGSLPVKLRLHKPKEQTIWRVIDPSIAFPATYDGRNLAQSSTRRHSHPRIRGSRGRHNRHDAKR
jgi:hypothetical protein